MDKRFVHLVAGSLWTLAACGGSVESQPGGGGSGGATVASGSTATTSGTVSGTTGPTGSGGEGAGTSSSSDATSVSSGSGGCTTHAECGVDRCIFRTGRCAPACEGDFCETCDEDTVCNTCATSSCPDCDDCLGACVPPEPGQCDDDTRCGGGDVCMFDWGACYPPCDAEGGCPDPSLVCVGCATGSCCGCRDCVDVCLPLEG